MDAWLDRTRQEIESAISGMTSRQLEASPEGKWSSAQILEHLGRAFGSTAKMLELQLASGKTPDQTAPNFRQRIANFLVIDLGHLPSGRTAPSMTTPQGNDGANSVNRILENLERMRLAIGDAERRWGTAKPIGIHPILGPLTSSQWRKFHFVHTRHHMRQVRERRSLARSATA